MGQPHADLLAAIEQKQARVVVAGLGYVGLPLGLTCAQAGFESVIGLDTDPAKVQALNNGQSYIKHIPGSHIEAAQAKGFSATGDFACVAEADVIVICVPTPLREHREPDLSYVLNTLAAMLPFLRAGQLISLESTTWPGTTEEELKPRIESLGLEVGKDVFLVFSPERQDPGNKAGFDTHNIPKVCGGVSEACQQVGVAFYSAVVETVVPVSSPKVAEMSKLLENIHRAVNIGLVNELKMAADRMGIDIYEVIEAAATKPFGFVPYYPGPGLGGHCIPIDPFYLTWKAREYGVNTRFIELAGEINDKMPRWVFGKLAEALNAHGKAIRGSRILVLGIAYKKNIDDLRASPALEVMELLRSYGADYAYTDPYVPSIPKLRDHAFDLQSVSSAPEAMSEYDCIMVMTDHDAFDYAGIQQNAKLIVDTRGVYRAGYENVIQA
ncbi:MAG: nucleotide sugar dehydrogenase [Salinisphaeraceae bacterium]|nr:nucleotide sugar dehydrogenase [Salinisphaeraceae bacterium]